MRLNRLLISLVVLGVASTAQAQVVNPGFESPVLASGPAGVQQFTVAGQGLPGWTVVGNDVLLIQTTYSEPSNGITFNAGEGLNSLDLTGVGNSGMTNGVTQIINTVVNQAYLIQFLVGRASGNAPNFVSPATVTFNVNGGPLTSFTNTDTTAGQVNWKSFSTIFVATGSTTTIGFYNGTTGVPAYVGLDGITIASIPEPGPIALAAVGLPFVAGLSWLRRRQGRVAA